MPNYSTILRDPIANALNSTHVSSSTISIQPSDDHCGNAMYTARPRQALPPLNPAWQTHKHRRKTLMAKAPPQAEKGASVRRLHVT